MHQTTLFTHRRSNLSCLALAFVLFILFTSCTKTNSTDKCPQFTPGVTTPVEAGGTIELTAPSDIEDVAYYHWTGPNGFESDEQDPVINNVQSDYAGRYTLEIGIVDGCHRSVKTDSVIITVPNSPCAPGNNTADIAGAITQSFSYINGHAAGGSYFITCNGASGDLELEFPGTGKPAPGVYTIQTQGGSWGYGYARAMFTAMSSAWPSSSGKLYVTVNNNKVTATFCNVPVSSLTYGYQTTASARVSEP